MNVLFNSRIARVAILIGAAVAPAFAQSSAFQSRADAILEAGPHAGNWSVLAISVDDGRTLFSRNSGSPLVPASNAKTFTSVWALDKLGPSFRFETRLWMTGSISADGTLNGDVILEGTGDPSFGDPTMEKDPMWPLRAMAASLSRRGVKRINGHVIGDGSIFDTVFVGSDWPNDAADGASAYAPRVSGLSFRGNVISVRIKGDGKRATVALDPAIDEIAVASSASVGVGHIVGGRRKGDPVIQVSGRVPAGRTAYLAVGVADPTLFAAASLRRAMIDAGIQVPAKAISGSKPVGATLVSVHQSIPLASLLMKMNHESDNMYAEHIFKRVTSEVAGTGTFDAGSSAFDTFLHSRVGATDQGTRMFGGSGLSRTTRATADALVASLRFAMKQPWGDTLVASLAGAGERDGTLRHRFLGTDAQGAVRAKTGTLNSVTSLAGVARMKDGLFVAFAFVYNGPLTWGAKLAEDRLTLLLASSSRNAPMDPSRLLVYGAPAKTKPKASSKAVVPHPRTSAASAKSKSVTAKHR